MFADLDNNRGPDDEILKDRFDDACAEALRVLCENHPDLREDLATGDRIKDAADVLFADIAIDATTAECRLSIQVLIKNHDVFTMPRSYGTKAAYVIEKADITPEQIEKMLEGMTWELRRDLIDYLLRGQELMVAKYEYEKGWDASAELQQNYVQLRYSVINAGAVAPETAED